MALADDLKTLSDDLTTIQGVAAQLATDASVPATESVGDTFLAASVAALEAAGYTVTAPETETSTEDSTDAASES